MKTLQYFSDDYLQQCQNATPEDILNYLESFRLMNATPTTSKLISMKIPVALLYSFRQKCTLENVRYQTQIKKLMEAWLRGRAE